MKNHLIRAALVCITVLATIPLAAQTASSSGVKGQASASDPNIQSDSTTNSLNQKVPAPAKKGGPKSRGLNGTCNIHIDNRTAWYVQFYFNGKPAGAMGPWGDLFPNITEGNAQLYGRAVFDNGSVITFGPRELKCVGNDFSWTLTP